MRHPLVSIVLAALLASAPAAASTPDSLARADFRVGAYPAPQSDPDPDAGYTLRAARLGAGASIEVDGRLDDVAWSTAAVASDFVQFRPRPGEAASERTEVRVLYDDDAVYVGMRLHDSEPGRIAAQLGRRDASEIYSDWAHVMIDSYHDRRTAFRFSVNPKGVQKDVLHYDDFNEDLNWDGVWEVETSMDAEGWVAEYRIPLSQLRFSTGSGCAPGVACDGMVWGINFGRVIARLDEWSWWSPILPDVAGFVSLSGELHGLQRLEAPRRLEMLPYAVAQGSQVPESNGNPFQADGGRDGTLSFGGDIKYGLTSDLTLSATINPDFGQVEADPSVFNLTAQETFFSERRPFFTEGSNIFGFGIGTDDGSGEGLFYTRRIGRSPQRGLDGDHTDSPGTTTILGAAKVSGRTAGGWSVGFMDALTAEETGRSFEGDSIAGYTVEPLTNYGVARVMKDFRDGNSRVGAMVTTTHRRMNGDAGLDFLTDQAYAGGLDVRHRFAGDTWDLNGWLAASHVLGDTAAIDRLQRSSARYYHRPDADHLDYDPGATSLSGYGGAANLFRVAGNVRGGVGGSFRSPGFEVNDAGFQTDADFGVVYGNLRYLRFDPVGPFRSFNIGINPSASWDFGGLRLHSQLNAWSNWTFLNNWHFGIWGSRAFDATSNGALRGGPAIRRPGAWRLNPWFNSDPRQPVWLNGWAFWSVEDEGAGWVREGGVDVNIRAAGRLDISLGPNVMERGSRWQYVDQVEDDDGQAHYLFAPIHQQQLSLTTRLSYAFTPTLSLQVYAQPYLTAGRYTGFREVTDPLADAFDDRFHVFTGDELSYVAPDDPDDWGAYEVDRDGDGAADYSFGEPDFNFKELRSNVVLRWEYRPGSTVYLVWSQGRTRTDSRGDFRVGDDLGRLLDAAGSNVLAVKVNYWLDF